MNDETPQSSAPASTSAPKEKGWRPTVKQVVGLVVLIVAVVFALLNTRDATIDVAFDEFRSPLWLVMLVMLVVGVLIGILLPVGRKKK